jgi:WD40 repeat protein
MRDALLLIVSVLSWFGPPASEDIVVGEPTILRGHSKYVYSVAFAPSGCLLASGSLDETVIIWDVSSGRPSDTIKGLGRPAGCVVFSPSSKALAVANGSSIVLWDISNRRALRSWSSGLLATSVAFSPDGETLAGSFISKEGDEIRVFDASTGEKRAVLEEHESTIGDLRFSPDGKTLATGHVNGAVKLWDLSSGRTVRTLGRAAAAVNSLAFAPGGREVATAGLDGVVRLWDVDSGRERLALSGHKPSANCVAFAPSGKIVASSGYDHTIKLWDVVTGAQRATLLGHTAPVNRIAFSQDGKMLASVSDDTTVRIWKIRE